MRLTPIVFRHICFSIALAVVFSCQINIAAAQQFDHTHADYDLIVKNYVTNGKVAYKSLKKDSKPLTDYLDRLGAIHETQFKGWRESERLAFLFNLYNASTLKLIVDNYPVKSIKDIGNLLKGPWDQPVVNLWGKKITLNKLEHGILRKEYTEPRMHMALVCAAKGCPPLRGEAYTAEKLNGQLDDQSRIYLSSSAGLSINQAKGVVYISSIFKWYADDFRSVPEFISRYASRPINKLKIKYIDYDWSLNEK